MKTTFYFLKLFLLATLSIWGCNGIGQEPPSGETIYYAVEINGVVCGYSESVISEIEKSGKPLIAAEDDVVLKLTILGQDVDISIRNNYEVDPATGMFRYCKHVVKTGVTTQIAISTVEGDKLLFATAEEQEPTVFELSPELILESSIGYPHLLKDFVEGTSVEKQYTVFDDMQGKIVTKSYTRMDDEELLLAGRSFQTYVFDELNMTSGVKSRIWLNKDDGSALKYKFSGRSIYLADASVKKKISMADMDNVLFARVNKVIPGLKNLTYVRVSAVIQSSGEWLTPESLNFPGQKFTGTVTDNLIDGVFEIEPEKYDGTGSPGFPYDFPIDAGLEEYIQPGNLIESDHPDLIAEAGRITEGARDSWDAVLRMSTWVGTNIRGAIPGGTSAINTYVTREGECGSHSRLLAALCRASGIPARLSIGCMYSPYLGGSFGQHAWTEVFMGNAGWIAIDATANEYDYVDAGHIRLGEQTSFNPRSMEILEYRVGDGSASADALVPEKYSPYIGKYTLEETGKVFTILYQDGILAVDIPDRMVLGLNDPDEEGLWYPELTRQINFKFLEDPQGAVVQMRLQQIIPVPKTSEEPGDSNAEKHEFEKFTGTYTLAQAKADFIVSLSDGALMLDDPVSKKLVELIPPLDGAFWVIKDGVNKVSFDVGDDGMINSMTYLEHIFLTRGEPVSGILKQWIDSEGVDAGIRKFMELKASGSKDYIISEPSLNGLGYSYLNAGRLVEAIAVFVLNAQEYPESWNVYDSLGEAYMKKGETGLAIENYGKSLQINPLNENGKNMIEKLKKEIN